MAKSDKKDNKKTKSNPSKADKKTLPDKGSLKTKEIAPKVVPKAVPPKTVIKGKKHKKVAESSDESSDSDDEPLPVVKPSKASESNESSDESSESGDDSSPSVDPGKVVQSSGESSEESSSSDDEPSPAVKPIKNAKPSKESSEGSSDSDDESSDSDEPSKSVLIKKNDASSESSGEESDAEMEDAPAVNGAKRKAEDSAPFPPKKMKLVDGNAAPTDDAAEQSKSIFVGRLSWSIDSDRLAQEFSECGEVVSATVQMDRNTGKSRGFGYVHFATTEAVEKALKMNGQEIDGRAVNIDRSQQLDKNQTREKRAQAFGDETSPPSATLFVGNLSFSVTEDTVWTFFNEWGVKSVRLPTDRETGRPKGFGYVEFEDVEGAKKAFEGAAGAEIEGRNIRLDYSQPRDSSGGGFGNGRGGGRGGDRGGFGGRGRGGDRGGRGRGFGDRGGRGRGGDRGGRGRGGRGGARHGGITAFEGKKTTF